MRKFHHSVLLLRHRLADLVTGPLALALLPVMLLVWYALGRQIWVLVALVAVPALMVLLGRNDRHKRQALATTRAGHIEYTAESFEVALRGALYRARLRETSVLCLIVDLDAHNHDTALSDPMALGELCYQDALLIRSFLRRRDQVFVLGQKRFGIVLNAREALTDENALVLGQRLKSDLEEGANKKHQPATHQAFVGLSLSSQGANLASNELIHAAKQTVQAARNAYADDVQLHTPSLVPKNARHGVLERDIEAALDGDGFHGWFQPQICARTRRVTGFETLARWVHPTEGVIPPSSFLPILQRRGLLPKLQDRMLKEALDGFEAWRGITDDPPAVGLNVAPEDLLDPTLPDRIMWELDRRRIDPKHLTIEVLEMVISKSRDDVTTRNIQRLAEIGCQIDLDDFGTGHASISSLQQFTVHRLKIDRSFVHGLEDNLDRRNMVAAILTMAKQLGLDTLAEGVETPAEEARLARLGCGHLQGYGIARAMPLPDALDWLAMMEAKAELTPLARTSVG